MPDQSTRRRKASKSAPIPPVAKGYKRQWCECRECGRVQYYDFVPYSLSSAVMVTACGCWPTQDVLKRIDADEAARLLANEPAAKGGAA